MTLWRRILTGAILCCGLANVAHAEAVRVLKMASPTTGDSAEKWMSSFKEGVERRSQGKIRVELYPGGQLGQIPATVEGVAMGTIGLSLATVGFFVGLEPRFGVLDAVGLFDDIEHAQRTLNDAALKQRIRSFGLSKGVEVIGLYAASPMLLISRNPVRSLSDLKEMKVRAPGAGAMHIAPLKRLGANPVSMSLGEAIPALQNRTIDGMMLGAGPALGFKTYDVAKNIVEVPGAFAMTGILANRSVLSSLGPELEVIVREEAAAASNRAPVWSAQDIARMKTVWQEKGGNFTTLSPADHARFAEEVAGVVREQAASAPVLRDDYDALKEAAGRNKNAPSK